MTVGRRLALSLSVLVACTMLMGGAAVVSLAVNSRHYRTSEEQYEQLRSLYEVGFHVAAVRQLVNAGAGSGEIQRQLDGAAKEAERLESMLGGSEVVEMRRSIRGRLEAVGKVAVSEMREDGRVWATGGTAVPASASPTSGALDADVNRWLGQVAGLTEAAQGRIVENRREAAADARAAVVGAGGLLFVTALLAGVVGVRQYRSVMRPLRELDEAVAKVAGAAFGHRVQEEGDLEFRRLMRQFNAMSGSIEELHASMRQQVEVKSRQLLRSEQLAGVGYLAAGLAHEINNPLAIIAGYAQTSLRKLERAQDGPAREAAAGRAKAALRIVSEEAFRCRDISGQLLRMAQPLEGEAGVVELEPLARRAVELVRRLPAARGRSIVLRCLGASEELVCNGHGSQLLQVFINLLVNALEACGAEGKVMFTLERRGYAAVASVADNGCGMDEKTLAHAFEPFFTDKAKRGLRGCGLGLSVSHVIIEKHAGRLFAQSDGLGLGSTFTVELPVFAEERHAEVA